MICTKDYSPNLLKQECLMVLKCSPGYSFEINGNMCREDLNTSNTDAGVIYVLNRRNDITTDAGQWVVLTLNLLNFLNRTVHLLFLELSIIKFGDMLGNGSWPANSIESGQTAWICRLTWLYTGGKGWTLPSGRIMVMKRNDYSFN